ncbi:MAG: hypothetical protein B6244_01380 [Candidatus Cloacimonetes bacterium 4572_55]|nr:MAG: hypothetical protein B6244_01380 [Candidatus Cloacimonetes bacterium 4572_55]
MTIGPYRLFSVSTSGFRLDGGAMFGVVPKTLWGKKEPADEYNRIEMGLNALLLQDTHRNILVDTGVGAKMSPKLCKIYAIDHSKTELIRSLKRIGLYPGDITDVILTHLHFDHAGGATCYQDGEIVPTFPNATYYIQKGQWELGNAASDKDRASFFPENFIPLKEHGQLEIVEGSFELFPHLHLIEVNGHTVSQQLVKVSDDKTTLLNCGDMIPLAAHISIPWVAAYDLYPLISIQEKKKYLAQAVDETWLLMFEHDVTCGVLGTIKYGTRGYQVDQIYSFDFFNF